MEDNDEFWDWVAVAPADVGRTLLGAIELLGAWQSTRALAPPVLRERIAQLNDATIAFLA